MLRQTCKYCSKQHILSKYSIKYLIIRRNVEFFIMCMIVQLLPLFLQTWGGLWGWPPWRWFYENVSRILHIAPSVQTEKERFLLGFAIHPCPHFLCPLSLSSCLSNKLRITLDSIVGKTFEKFSPVAFPLIFTPFWRACNMKIEAWRRWHHLTHIEHHSRQGSRASECATSWPLKVFKTPDPPHIPQNSPSPISSQIGFVQYWPTDPLSPDDGFCIRTNSSDRITFHFFCQNMSLFNGNRHQSLVLKNVLHKTWLK